ncbi:hypothetical protein ACYFX5_00475 [Bremerella sp. T1]|uniref:hypothetical protein n=1 Tax=Bremerella sp. TYQ1 TaxID=3119568 RepID=UPI001CC92D21|nr:hypothetical protein [Bremerella volcania]UBM36765.1 hypothetical protein LA756_02435 [Bremerella volcania]
MKPQFVLNVLVSSFLIAGCFVGKNAGVEHLNVSIDLSPDGKTLVFSSADGDLFLFDIRTSIATRLTDTQRIESHPSFSPDGKQIVFAAKESVSAASQIFVLDVEDQSIVELTGSDDRSDLLPRFTPDGKRIVFARAYQHRPYSLGGWRWDMWDVCSIAADGSDPTRLTNEGYYQLFRIVPRSDGTLIYAADTLSSGKNIPAALYTITPGSVPVRIVPERGIPNSNVHAWAIDPMVSPDEKATVFCSDRTKPFWYDVCIKTDDSESKCLVGSKSRSNRYPDFFPDGKRIVFLAGTDVNAGNRSIYSLWEVSLTGQSKELASSDLFTNPTNWLGPEKAEPPKVDLRPNASK